MRELAQFRTEAYPGHAQVMFGMEVIADSRFALCLYETGYGPVLYFPVKDIQMNHLQADMYHSFCPYKGTASYWTLQVRSHTAENAAWSYANPLPSASEIKGYIAFQHKAIKIIQTDNKGGEL